MIYVYMNEHIKEAKTEEPVIATYETQGKHLVYSNFVEIQDRHGAAVARVKYDPKGVKGLPHFAKAWIEVYTVIGTAKVRFF